MYLFYSKALGTEMVPSICSSMVFNDVRIKLSRMVFSL